MQNQCRVGSVRLNLTSSAPEFRGEVFAAIDSCVRRYPKSPLETRRLIFGLRFVRGPKHCVAQTNGTLQPARLGIGTTIGEKIHKRLQERPLYRRTVPVVDTHDAAQSACLSIRAFCTSHDEKEWQCRQLRPKKRASPFCPGMGPEGKFSGKENSIAKCCLAGIVLYCWPSPAATATCSVDFSSNKDVGIRNHTR